MVIGVVVEYPIKKDDKMDNIKRRHAIYECLSCLPEKMISVHGAKNLSEFLLHELSDEPVFNLQKAAYFVDNPDFNTFKGVAGYDRKERCKSCPNIWNQPEVFTDYMSKSDFNNKVRSVSYPSMKKSGQTEEDLVKKIADNINLKNPAFYSWNMKHDNHGILVVEHVDLDNNSELQDDIRKGLFFLGFCPVR